MNCAAIPFEFIPKCPRNFRLSPWIYYFRNPTKASTSVGLTPTRHPHPNPAPRLRHSERHVPSLPSPPCMPFTRRRQRIRLGLYLFVFKPLRASIISTTDLTICRVREHLLNRRTAQHGGKLLRQSRRARVTQNTSFTEQY